MLSEDLRSFRAVLERRALMFDGQVFLDARQTAAAIELVASLADQIDRLEQTVVPPAARALPEGVADLSAARRRRDVAPVGGDAA